MEDDPCDEVATQSHDFRLQPTVEDKRRQLHEQILVVRDLMGCFQDGEDEWIRLQHSLDELVAEQMQMDNALEMASHDTETNQSKATSTTREREERGGIVWPSRVSEAAAATRPRAPKGGSEGSAPKRSNARARRRKKAVAGPSNAAAAEMPAKDRAFREPGSCWSCRKTGVEFPKKRSWICKQCNEATAAAHVPRITTDALGRDVHCYTECRSCGDRPHRCMPGAGALCIACYAGWNRTDVWD